MSIVPTWPITAAVLAAGVALGAGADHLWMQPQVTKAEKRYTDLDAQVREQARLREVQRGQDERVAREKEKKAAEDAAKFAQGKEDENARIRAQLADANLRLQNRPDRKPSGTSGLPPVAPACAGSTGAELSRSDAGFLIGEAARANELRAALIACYGTYDAGRAALSAPEVPRPDESNQP